MDSKAQEIALGESEEKHRVCSGPTREASQGGHS